MPLTSIFKVVKQSIKSKGQDFPQGPIERASVKHAQIARLRCHHDDSHNPLCCACKIHRGFGGDPQRKQCIVYVDEYCYEENTIIKNVTSSDFLGNCTHD